MSPESEALKSTEEANAEESQESHTLRVIWWFSVGVAVAALGIYVGNEVRKGYKFKNRTPYDFYANAGKKQVGEFGVGV